MSAYGKVLSFKPEMEGEAEIIIEDLSVFTTHGGVYVFKALKTVNESK